MDVVSTLVAHSQPPEAVDPRERSFHHPPVSAQFLAGVDAPPCYARCYGSLSQRLAASAEVVGLVSAWSFLERFLGRPRRGLRIGEIVSTASSRTLESWTFAAVWIIER